MDSAEKRKFLRQRVDCRKRGGDIFLYSACRFARVSLAGMASQHRTIIRQIGTDVAQTDILEMLIILARV